MSHKPKLLRITTVPISLKLLLKGQLSFFKGIGFEVLAVSADGPEIKSLQEEGIDHRIVPMTRTITPFRDFIALIQLIGVIRRFKPDIVHTHTPKAGLLGMMAARVCRVPVRLHTVAGLPVMEKKGMVRSLLLLTEKITYSCATRVYPNSTGLLKFIKAKIHTKTPLKIIGKGSSNGINTDFFSPSPATELEAKKLRHQYNISDNEIVFSFIGRIVTDKGINELLSAFDSVSQRFRCKLLLAGPFENHLDPISKESRKILARNKNAIAMGYVDDVRPLLLASDVFVFPSYREGFPNVVMQACCMDCACIATDINGCNEIIVDNRSGLLVPPKSTANLIDAMNKLAHDNELRRRLSKEAHQFVVENFDQRLVWNELFSEYIALLGKGPVPDQTA